MHYTILLVCLLGFASSLPLVEKDPMEGDLFEGDIAGVSAVTPFGLGILDKNKKWPNGVVPYTIAAGVYTQTQLNNILRAMRHIENQTRRSNGQNCITFTPRTTQADHVSIQSQTGCWSSVGRQGGAQVVSLQVPGCVGIQGIPIHELTHALGFWHEQSRPDRDNYIAIQWQNIKSGTENNFQKYTTNVDTLGFSYDLNSIMHYPSTAFSVNGQPTIRPLRTGVSIGQRTGLSTIDSGEIKKLYGCA